MRQFGKLSARRVEQLARKRQPGRYGDGRGLYLQISKWGTSSWMLRYQLAGRCRDMGLGPYPAVTLKTARAAVEKLQRDLHDPLAPKDPIDVRRAEQRARMAEAAKQVTFQYCAERYIEAHRAS